VSIPGYNVQQVPGYNVQSKEERPLIDSPAYSINLPKHRTLRGLLNFRQSNGANTKINLSQSYFPRGKKKDNPQRHSLSEFTYGNI
jgi:hypothetical protein